MEATADIESTETQQHVFGVIITREPWLFGTVRYDWIGLVDKKL